MRACRIQVHDARSDEGEDELAGTQAFAELASVAWLVEADGVQQSMRMLALMHLEDAANVVVEIVSLLDL